MNKIDQICIKCIMDTTDPNIIFDESGKCDHCINFEEVIYPKWTENLANSDNLLKLASKIRTKNKDFDCIIGLSGGLDSSYAAYCAKELMGLKPLLFHVDAGWNTNQAVENIEKIVDGLNLDLYTDVINWDSIKRMQLAFFKAGIPDLDLVQDAAFFSGLYKYANKYKIKHIITGSNFSTECCREPEEWGGYLGIDTKLFNDIYKVHGDKNIKNDFKIVDILTYKIYYQRIKGMSVHYPLNFVKYVKKDAERLLNNKFGWKAFKHKHHESRFTRFYEDFWLPRRFGFDKRKAHFSSLILTNQMERNTALERIQTPEMDEQFLKQEFDYIANKLEIDATQLNDLFNMELKYYHNYKNKRNLILMGAKILKYLGIEKRNFK